MICILAPPLFQTLEQSPSDAHPMQTPALMQRKTNVFSPLSVLPSEAWDTQQSLSCLESNRNGDLYWFWLGQS